MATLPPEYLFKSGTTIAMIEHGLRVIATRPPFRYVNYPSELQSIGMRNVLTGFDLEGLKRAKPDSLLPTVAGQFIEDLSRV